MPADDILHPSVKTVVSFDVHTNKLTNKLLHMCDVAPAYHEYFIFKHVTLIWNSFTIEQLFLLYILDDSFSTLFFFQFFFCDLSYCDWAFCKNNIILMVLLDVVCHVVAPEILNL